MLIVTAANSIRDSWAQDSHFSFKEVIQHTARQASEFGYDTAIYDLGSLGIGEPFYVDDPTFQSEGYYKQIGKRYRSRSLFKPDILLHSLRKHRDDMVYLDGDALLYDRLDEVFDDEFDVGVTLRARFEMQGAWYQEHYEIAKFLNAGVVFLRPTAATERFLERWKDATEELGNDQKALNSLACRDSLPRLYAVDEIDGVRFKYFPTTRYNYYYFERGFPLFSRVSVLHFKGEVRKFYPFTLRKKLRCRFLSPAGRTAGMLAPQWAKSLLRKMGLLKERTEQE